MRSKYWITLLTVGLFSCGAWAGYAEALIEYKKENYAVAMNECLAPANNTYADCQTMIGVIFDVGLGLPQDYKQAVAWYRKAVEQGYAEAQKNLGWMYDKGQGVPQDYKQAVAWYRKAAEQGNASAQKNLGWMYDSGRGVPQDYKEAVAWYRKAAEQGNADAQNNLGVMYKNGQGVQQDSVLAYVLYNLGAAGGNDKAAENRADLIAQLTPKQIEEGQRLAAGWKVGTLLPLKTMTGLQRQR